MYFSVKSGPSSIDPNPRGHKGIVWLGPYTQIPWLFSPFYPVSVQLAYIPDNTYSKQH